MPPVVSRFLNILLITLFVVSILAGIYIGFFSKDTSPSYSTPTSSDDLIMVSTKGKRFDKNTLKNKVVLVNFWATWCAPCRLEIPELNALQDHYSPDELQIIGISLDDRERTATSYMKNMNITYPLVMSSTAILAYFGQISAIPTTVIFNKDFEQVHMLQGYRNIYELKEIINTYL